METITVSYSKHSKGSTAHFTVSSGGQEIRQFPLAPKGGYEGKKSVFEEVRQFCRTELGAVDLYSQGGQGEKQTWTSVAPPEPPRVNGHHPAILPAELAENQFAEEARAAARATAEIPDAAVKESIEKAKKMSRKLRLAHARKIVKK